MKYKYELNTEAIKIADKAIDNEPTANHFKQKIVDAGVRLYCNQLLLEYGNEYYQEKINDKQFMSDLMSRIKEKLFTVDTK